MDTPSGADRPRLETRELAYVVAVAEELHFGRAAARLRIAQPPLSRAIRQLERRLGARLLDRDSHGVALTPAGETLLHDARQALCAIDAAAHRARRAARPEPQLVLAVKPGADGALLPAMLAAYAATPAAVHVDIRTCAMSEQLTLLRNGQADAAVLHANPDTPDALAGLNTAELRTEGRVAALPANHPLAAHTTLAVADLKRQPLPIWPPGVRGDTFGEVRDGTHLAQLIALGRAVALLPESARLQIRRDVTCVPVPDAPPATILLAWPEHSRSPTLATFIRAAIASTLKVAPD